MDRQMINEASSLCALLFQHDRRQRIKLKPKVFFSAKVLPAKGLLVRTTSISTLTIEKNWQLRIRSTYFSAFPNKRCEWRI